MTLYYADILSTGSSGDYGGMVALTGHAAALLLALLAASVDERALWQASLTDISEVTDAQWDIIDTWFGAAGEGLMTSLAGVIISYATTLPPSGTLPCDGTQYLRVDYPRLYAALDPVYIIDADNFIVPDLQDRVIVGESATRVTGDTGGAETHTLTIAQMPRHSHGYTEPDPKTIILIGELTPQNVIPTRTGSQLTGERGNDQPHNNMQPYHVLRYGIMT